MSRQQALADLDGLPVTPQLEQQSETILGDAETALVEKAACGRDERSVGEVLQGRPAPQCERFTQCLGRLCVLARVEQLVAPACQLLEHQQVQLAGAGAQEIAGRLRQDGVGARGQRTAQLGDVDLQTC